MDSIFACKLAFELDAFDSNGQPMAYFSSVNNQQLLEQVYQHGCYTEELLLVWGEDGLGKSCLLQALEKVIHSEAVVLKLDAGLDMDAESLAQAYQQAFQAYANAQGLQPDAEQWLLIDNAEQLQTEAVKYLTDVLLQQPRMTACLFSRSVGQEHILQAVSQTPHQNFHLQPLSESDLAGYLRTRLISAGLSEEDIQLDDQLLEQIYLNSRGVPAVINKVAKEALRRSLANVDVAVGTQTGKNNTPWMSYLVASVGVLLLTSGALWVLYQPDRDNGQTKESLATELSVVPELAQEASLTQPSLAASGADKAEQAAANIHQRLKQAIAKVDKAPVDKLRQQTSDGWQVSSPVEQQRKAQDKKESLLAEPESRNNTKPIDVLKPQPPKSELTTKITEKPANTTKQPQFKAEPKKKPPEKTKTVLSTLSDAEAVLMALDKRHYVLQLAGARSLASLKQFRQGLPARYRGVIYQRSLQSKPWFVLVFGDFPTRAAARLEIKRLSSRLKSQRPWIKPVAAVQAEIRANM